MIKVSLSLKECLVYDFLDSSLRKVSFQRFTKIIAVILWKIFKLEIRDFAEVANIRKVKFMSNFGK